MCRSRAPRRCRRPAPGVPKVSRTVPKPEAVMPTVPAGFTVTTYAELQAPRMMVYAPNGDLFVSSPAANIDRCAARRQQRRHVRSVQRLCRGRSSGSRAGRTRPAATTAAGGSAGLLRTADESECADRAPRSRPGRSAAPGRWSRVRAGGQPPVRRPARGAARRQQPPGGGRGGPPCSAPMRRRARRRRSSCRRARANFARRSASPSMTAISTSATRRRSFATSTRTAI